jgi:hypothetical protein
MKSSQIKAKTIDELIKHICALYSRHSAIKRRVNKSSYYYDLGIICEKQWGGPKGRRAFIKWSLTHGFEPTLELDRIDNSGNYSPKNCRWVTHKENCRNRSTDKIVVFNGKKISLKDLYENNKCATGYNTLISRVNKGWPLKKAMSFVSKYMAHCHRKA